MKHHTSKLFHKTLSLIIALALLCSLLPLSVLTTSAIQADYTLYFVPAQAGGDGIMYKGTPGEGQTRVQESEGVSISGNTITFTDFQFSTTAAEGLVIQGGENVEIIAVGTNGITLTGTASTNARGISTQSDITFSGSGSLTVTASTSSQNSYGIHTNGKNLAFTSGTFTFEGGETTSRTSYESIGIRTNALNVSGTAKVSGSTGKSYTTIGVRTYNGINISGSGSVSGVCADSYRDANGVVVTGAAVVLSDSGSLSGSTGVAVRHAYGIRMFNGVSISDKATITGTAADAGEESNGVAVDGAAAVLSGSAALSGTAVDGHEAFGVRIFKGVSVSDEASLTGIAGNATYNSRGIDAEDKLTQSGGSVLGIGGARANARNFGVVVRGAFTQTGGSIEGISGATKEEADAIVSEPQVAQEPNSFGIFINTFANISAGTMKGTGGYSNAHSYGIIAKGMKASGTANVYGEGGQADSNSNGIRVEESEFVLSDNAVVSGKSGYGNNSYGVRFFSAVTISDNAQLIGTGVDAAGSSFGIDISSGAGTYTQTGGSVLGVSGIGGNGSSFGIWSAAKTTLSGNAAMQGRGAASTKNINTGIYINAAVSVGDTAVLKGVSETGSTSNGVNIGNALNMSTGMVWGASATSGTAIRTSKGANITEAYVVTGTTDTFTNPTTSVITLRQSGTDPVIIRSVGSYTLQVVNGTDNTNAGPYAPGQEVSITADTAVPGYEFDRWVLTSGSGTFTDPTSPATTFTTGVAATVITATYRAIPDDTPPTGAIKIGTGTYTDLESTITHSTFFNQNQSVSITATDDIQVDVAIQYYLHNGDAALTLEELEALTAWNDYTASFSISNEGKLVVYAKLTDAAGNVAYISTNGIVLDKTAPSITGITNNQTYNEDVTFTASDDYLQSLTVNTVQQLEDTFSGTSQEVSLTADGSYTIIATDKAGNSTTVAITIHTHTLSHTEAKAATCAEAGNIEYWYCEGCSKYFSDENAETEITLADTVIAATGEHTGGEATCVASATCTVCGNTYGERDPNNHTGGTEIRNAVPATETTEGYTGDTYCLGCNTKISGGTVIPATGASHEHNWGNWLNNADGHWKACACGETTDAESHKWGKWTTTLKPTAAENGSRERKCTVCGYVQTESIPSSVEAPGKDTPQTGDPLTPISAFVLLMFVLAGGVLVVLKIRRIALER